MISGLSISGGAISAAGHQAPAEAVLFRWQMRPVTVFGYGVTAAVQFAVRHAPPEVPMASLAYAGNEFAIYVSDLRLERTLERVTDAELRASIVSLEEGEYGKITAATDATPIVVTTAQNHGLESGARVTIVKTNGNTAAIGSWEISSAAAATFTLEDSAGSGAYLGDDADWFLQIADTIPLTHLGTGTYRGIVPGNLPLERDKSYGLVIFAKGEYASRLDYFDRWAIGTRGDQL
ncbi:MAG: hypothetical protein KF777_15780 [Planctomycetaceae bacterium]|nr:hypothetical protein [Planctomycetaceae bacterium]